MDESVRYAEVMSNFSSAYNATPTVFHPTVYIPMPPVQHDFHLTSRNSSSRSPFRITSPLSYSSLSDNNSHDFFDSTFNYLTPRSTSSTLSLDSYRPQSTVIVHHPVNKCYKELEDDDTVGSNAALVKLRISNNQLSDALAMLDDLSPREKYNQHDRYSRLFNVQSSDVYNYPPNKRHPYEDYTNGNTTDDQPKRHNAKVSYSIQGRRRQPLSRLDQVMMPTSDTYSSDDLMTYNNYSSQRKSIHTNKRSRLVNDMQLPLSEFDIDVYKSSRHKSQRRHSSTKYKSKLSDKRNYNDTPTEASMRLSKSRNHSDHRSSFKQPSSLTYRVRSNSASFHMSDSSQERSFDRSIQNGKHKKSMDLSLRPDDKIRHQKSIKAFDPQSTKRVHEQESIPTSASKTIDKNKAIKNFDPKSKPEFIKMDPTTKYISGSQSEPVQSQQRATSTNKNVPKPKVEKLDPKLKKPIVSAKKISASEDETPSNIRTGVKLKSPNAIKKKIESSEIDTDDEKQMLKSTKINSTEKKLIESTNKTAEGTREQTNIRQSSINHEPKIVPKPKTSTDITAEQMLPSVPKSKERSKDPTKDSMIIDEQDDLRRDRKEKSVVIEKKTERKGDVPSTPERTLTPTSEPEEVKENMLVKNNDRNESLKDSKRSPLKEKNLSKTSETIKPTSDNESPIKYGTENHDQGDATDKAQFFKWLDDQSRAIIGGEKSTGRQSDKKASNQSINQKTSEQSPSPEDIYKPPFGPKISTSREQIKDKEHEPQPTSTKTDHIKPEVHDVPDNDVDEFFS